MGSLITGWIMLGLSIGLFMISLAIYLYGLREVFVGKRFPDDTDTPCMLAFLVLGIIFLNLGVVYRDMAVHPELFEEEMEQKNAALKKREEWENIRKRVKGYEGEFLRDPSGEGEDEEEEGDEGEEEKEENDDDKESDD